MGQKNIEFKLDTSNKNELIKAFVLVKQHAGQRSFAHRTSQELKDQMNKKVKKDFKPPKRDEIFDQSQHLESVQKKTKLLENSKVIS